MPQACDFFNGWWRDSSSLIVYHDSHFVYWFGWFKYISMHVWMLDFHLLSNCIIWGYWSLVMHEFTLALVGSINTFILHHYFLRRMLLVATLWTDGSYSWTNFRSMEITDTASTNIAVCRMSSLLLIFSTFFDDNSGAGSTQDYFELQLCSPQGLLDMVAGPGGRRLHGRLPQGKSPSLEAAGFRQQDTQMDSLPFSICLRSFIPD